MDINIVSLCVAAIIACCVGLLTGIFGIGGGFLTTPALMVFLGIPGPIAVGTGVAIICVTSSLGVCKRRGTGTIDTKLACILALGSSLGVLFGVFILSKLKHMPPLIIRGKEHVAAHYLLLWTFLVIIVAIACLLMFDMKINSDKLRQRSGVFTRFRVPPYGSFNSIESCRISLIPMVALSFCIGMLTGFLGIGGGVILFPALVYLLGQQAGKAVGTSLMVMWITTIIGVIGHFQNGNINLHLLASMTLGGLIGIHYGTKIGLKLHDHKLHFYFSFVVLTSVLMVAIEIFRETF